MTTVNYASTGLDDEKLNKEFENQLKKLRSADSPIETNLIGGHRFETEHVISRKDPVQLKVQSGAAYTATPELVTKAVSAAKEASKEWRKLAYSSRNKMLYKARDEILSEMSHISALLALETGKTRLEAYGETQEVVDMITHYCSQFSKNHGFVVEQEGKVGERNFDILLPYGVFAVIVPFNFPVALMVGMSVAALVTGNTVVIKPSNKTPRASAFVAGIIAKHLPDGVVNIVHGGATVGQQLVESDVDGIAFTGSAQVGWKMHETKKPNGMPRPVLAEMGGQNPAIVTASADLEAAATGIVRSAFGLSGQKCSACRRVIVDEKVADELIGRLKGLTEALVVGDPLDSKTNLGPVIDDAIAHRIDEALSTAQADGTIVTGGKLSREGNFYAPIIVADLPKGHVLTREELFAPFLTVTRVSNLEEAIQEANASQYGLSAGIFTALTSEADQFFDDIEAGVLYTNRASGATTGAWPGMQSFCGWKMSGTAGKGGLGVHYLQGFMREQNRTMAELK